jgi:hypothetical protein
MPGSLFRCELHVCPLCDRCATVVRVQTTDCNGITPLALAARLGHTETVALLQDSAQRVAQWRRAVAVLQSAAEQVQSSTNCILYILVKYSIAVCVLSVQLVHVMYSTRYIHVCTIQIHVCNMQLQHVYCQCS